MKPALRSSILAALALVATLPFVPSCGGGGDGSVGSISGTISVSLTDAPSDQVDSFRVEVSSLVVHKSNGTSLQALAGPVVVDLADMTDTGQLLNSLTATVGTYTSVTITLEMSTAVVVLAGQSSAATVHNDQGAAFLAPLVVDVNIPYYLSLGSSVHKLIELDLDLSQSLLIDAANNTVEFTPSFVVRTVLAQQKPVFVAGTFESADLVASTFVLALEDENGGSIGSVTCTSDNATVFQTDGVPALGGAGLTALSLMPVGTWVQAWCTLDPTTPELLATSVSAGIGTWNGGTDIVEGVVIDRVGGAGADATLTVLGRSVNAAHDTFQYDTSFTVTTTMAGTHVVRHASATAYDTDDVNIGQQVRIFGTLSGAAMDASTGVLREQPTWIYGTAAGAPAGGQLTLSLISVGLRDQALFTWTANPAVFVTGVDTLADALAIDLGSHVVERGYFVSVGGSNPDFIADRVINADTAPSLLLVRNRLATGFTVGLTCTTGQIDITIAGGAAAGEFAILGQPFVGFSNLPSVPTPDIVPAGVLGLYVLRNITAGTFTIYTYFPTYSSAVALAVSGGAEVRHVGAIGSWAPGTSTISAGLVSIVVQ